MKVKVVVAFQGELIQNGSRFWIPAFAMEEQLLNHFLRNQTSEINVLWVAT